MSCIKMIIGITGKLGSGKDYCLVNVVERVLKARSETYVRMNFADQLKVNVMTKHKLSYDSLYVRKTAETRKLLQREGTDIGRNENKNIWIDYFNNWMTIHNERDVKHIICSDVRFKNESEYIKNNGGILIKVIAPKRNEKRLREESNGSTEMYKEIKNHSSECDLDEMSYKYYDMIIQNDPEYNLMDYYRNQLNTIIEEKQNEMASKNE